MAINILLMGETGTGKTTFINAFSNYLAYNMLDDALNGELRVLIPSKFTVGDRETFESCNVFFGNTDAPNAEKPKTGQSATESCHAYLFSIGSRLIRLIDVPGVGDTRGIDQDPINLELMLAYISQYQYINGICVFLKPDENRLKVCFRYCIKEILRHLHVNTIENIMFVFTHAQSTNFTLGSTAEVLRKLIQNLKNSMKVEIPFNRGNSFFFDNEAFRFVARCKQNIKTSMDTKERVSRSWSKSVDETGRMIEFILKRHPSPVEDTQSLITAKRLMSQLARPVAEAVKLLHEYESLVIKYKDNIKTPLSQLQPDSTSQRSVRLVELSKPLTVCIDPRCTQLVTINGQRIVDYNKYCHNGCYLKNVVQECIGHPFLKHCAAMSKNGSCKQCGCEWRKHMHVTYRLELDTRSWLQKLFSANSPTPEETIKLIEKRIAKLRQENETIRGRCLELSAFIRKNSIVSFNNDILEYLQMYLTEKKQDENNDANQRTIRDMEDTIAKYQEKLKFHEEIEKEAQQQSDADRNEIEKFFQNVNELYKLEFTGEMIKMQVDHIQRVSNDSIPTQDIHVEVPVPSDGSTLLIQLSKMNATNE